MKRSWTAALFSICCLIFAVLVITGEMKEPTIGLCVPVYAADATPSLTPGPSLSDITSIYVKYKSEEIEVNSTSKVYYCVLKKATDTSAKASEFSPASYADGSPSYLIDISTLSASKDNYIGITTLTKAEADGTIKCKNVAIPANQKKITFTVNWGVEGPDAKGLGILQSVEITTSTETVKYVHSPKTGEKNITGLEVEWRKGANCAWQSMDKLTEIQWESMKNSGAIINFRLAAKDDASGVKGYRYSKENKVKLAITKATAIKLDVSKLAVSIKNGMQFRVVGTKKWYTILPFDAKSTNAKALRTVTLGTVFDPFTESTSAKVSYLSLDDLYEAMGIAGPAGPDDTVLIESRIAATTKKPASRITTLTLPYQAQPPVTTLSSSNGNYVVGTITPDANDKAPTKGYEYFIAKKEDVTKGAIDFAAIKWSSVNSGSQLKPTLKSTYTKTTGGVNARTDVYLKDDGAVLLIRRKGIAGSAKTAAYPASKYIMLEIPKLSNATPTPAPSGTPTPVPSPTVTPSPVPTPSVAPTPAP